MAVSLGNTIAQRRLFPDLSTTNSSPPCIAGLAKGAISVGVFAVYGSRWKWTTDAYRMIYQIVPYVAMLLCLQARAVLAMLRVTALTRRLGITPSPNRCALFPGASCGSAAFHSKSLRRVLKVFQWTYLFVSYHNRVSDR